MAAFTALRSRCAGRASLFTYSTATQVRSALLLAGFYVGAGDPSGPKGQTTSAATQLADLAQPLDRRWLERVRRSSAPWPADAPDAPLTHLLGHPQFIS